jgi:hypothetical protein
MEIKGKISPLLLVTNCFYKVSNVPGFSLMNIQVCHARYRLCCVGVTGVPKWKWCLSGYTSLCFLRGEFRIFLETNLNYLMNNRVNLILNMSSGGQLVVCMQNLSCSVSFECMVGVTVEI